MSADCNESVTIDCNVLLGTCRSQKQRDFLTRALKINLEQHCTFSKIHFPEFTQTNYRQMIFKLRKLGLIELDNRSSVGFYKVTGVKMPLDHRRITFEGMGVGTSMIPILRMLRNQPPSIHDIKLKFNSSKLHEYLKEIYHVNPANQGIIVQRPLGDYIHAKILVYPNTVQIDLACTMKPFVCDIGSAINLAIQMGQLHEYFLFLTSYRATDIPFPGKWVVTHYHFGKDGKETCSGERFERKFEDLTGGLIRFYSKEMPDGKTIPRLELLCSTHHTLNEQVDQMIQEEYAALNVTDNYY